MRLFFLLLFPLAVTECVWSGSREHVACLQAMEIEEQQLEQKLKKAELELEELKQRRTEDAKANEKVVAIFASHEQRWIAERKALRLQIQALVNELQSTRSTHEEAISVLEKRLEAAAARRTEELEQQRHFAEQVAEEAAARARKAAQDHAAELWKHKTALVELVSSQRRMEAEMGRTLQQAEAAAERREAAALALVDKVQKDSEQKDKILSAMLRKSKLDAAERQAVLREVKMAKARKKQAELEAERWRGLWESSSRHKKKGARDLPVAEMMPSQSKSLELPLGSLESEGRRREASTMATPCYNHYSVDDQAEQGMDDYQELQDWVRKETLKYTTILEQKHYAEIEAFTEQMRQKDERIEASRWRLLSMELEKKRLSSHIEGLEDNLNQLREENIKLEAMLLNKEQEIMSMREQHSFNNSDCQALSREVKVTEKEENTAEKDGQAIVADQVEEAEIMVREINKSDSAEPPPSPTQNFEPTSSEISSTCDDQAKSAILISDSAVEENVEEEVSVELVNAQEPHSICLVRKDTSWKMDIQALGVSHKIRRLKQQLVVLEKLVAPPAVSPNKSRHDEDNDTSSTAESDDKSDENGQQIRDLLLLKSLLNKQLKRYQSLEQKTDALCRRMQENYRSGSRRELQNGRTKEQTESLQRFLEETFQLQRIMVATGQKLMEMQARIASFQGATRLDESVGVNLGQFVDIVRTLFREIQRGLEVRIARIIGDLEGTLACEGILQR